MDPMSPPALCSRVLLAVGILLVACASPAAEAPRATSPSAGAAAPRAEAVVPSKPVVISANQAVTSNLVIWVAQAAGLFATHGVDVDLQSINALVAMKAFVAGELQGIWVGGAELLAARASGVPLTIVGVFAPAYNQVMMAPPSIGSVAALRGKTVGIITYPSVNGVGTV